MATKADFTEDEWKTMQKGVTGAGLLVSVGDRDFTDSFGEAGALARVLTDQHEKSESPFIRELANVHRSGFGMTGSAQKIQTETLEALRAATAALTAKAPDELDAYRQLVDEVVNAVAEAKGGVKPGETAAIAAVKEAMGSV
jgi:hypothetical protein